MTGLVRQNFGWHEGAFPTRKTQARIVWRNFRIVPKQFPVQ